MARSKKPLHPAPSLSKSALLLSPCVAWADPQAKWYDDRFADTSKRDRGTTFHSGIHRYVTGAATGSDLALEARDDHEMQCWYASAVVFVDTVMAPRCQSIMSEVAIAVNWITGESVILSVDNREYPAEYHGPDAAKKGWQCGTADLVCILKDGSLLIADWKTGGTDGAKEQLLSLGYGFQKAMPETYDNMGVPQERSRRVKVSCLKVFTTGVDPDEDEVSSTELALHKDAMHFAVEAIGTGVKPVPGIHCTALYCPHLAFCPAVTGIVEEAAEGPQGLLAPEALVRRHKMTDDPSSAEEAGYVMARVTAAKRQLDYFSNAMKDYVRKGGLVTCGSYAWSNGKDGFRWRRQ